MIDNRILFAWDYHGVLEKDNIYAVQELCNLILGKYNTGREISIEETIQWYGLSWFDYFKLAFPEGDQDLWGEMVKDILSLQRSGWGIVSKHIKPREFAIDVLRTIRDAGHHNILISNSRPKDTFKFAEIINATEYFREIIGVATNKDSQLKQGVHTIKRKALLDFIKRSPGYRKVIVIGDKESDIRAGMDCGTITYLFCPPELADNLSAIHISAHFKINDLRDVLEQL